MAKLGIILVDKEYQGSSRGGRPHMTILIRLASVPKKVWCPIQHPSSMEEETFKHQVETS